ncbi:hypothetical protein M1295_00560 [Patescibacteria group bacterium]|nr:hypothetical protein [Patescibacteria group bacterium]
MRFLAFLLGAVVIVFSAVQPVAWIVGIVGLLYIAAIAYMLEDTKLGFWSELGILAGLVAIASAMTPVPSAMLLAALAGLVMAVSATATPTVVPA